MQEDLHPLRVLFSTTMVYTCFFWERGMGHATQRHGCCVRIEPRWMKTPRPLRALKEKARTPHGSESNKGRGSIDRPV